MKANELWTALMLCDSSFPGGSLGHSLGLESAIKNGFISTRENDNSLKQYIRLVIDQVS